MFKFIDDIETGSLPTNEIRGYLSWLAKKYCKVAFWICFAVIVAGAVILAIV